jgi:DNA-binding SARP family transcriptional activator
VTTALWVDVSADRGGASLRSTIWRTPAPDDRPLILATGTHVSLAPEVSVDFQLALSWASSMVCAAGRGHGAAGIGDSTYSLDQGADHGADLDGAVADFTASRWWNEPTPALYGDLLPEWDEDWVVLDRERFRQLRLHALEAQCERLSAAGRYGEALELGLAAVEAEPLRESARRAVVRVHLREGNAVEALRAYAVYERLLEAELGLQPSPTMRRLVHELTVPSCGRALRLEASASSV